MSEKKSIKKVSDDPQSEFEGKLEKEQEERGKEGMKEDQKSLEKESDKTSNTSKQLSLAERLKRAEAMCKKHGIKDITSEMEGKTSIMLVSPGMLKAMRSSKKKKD